VTGRSHVTTHVLDAALGRPASGVAVRLERLHRDDWETVATGRTDADGRCGTLGPERLDTGTYRLRFATGSYFDEQGRDTFYPEVTVVFDLADAGQHFHVPLLLSPFAYSTYRGS
jgi:5-hydroxyisourate hydrolase